MEEIVNHIKTTLAQKSVDEVTALVPVWRSQFQNRGISVVALENLLNHYLNRQPAPTETVQEGFMLPSERHSDDRDALVNQLRNKIAVLELDNRKKEQQLQTRQRQVLFALVAAVFCLVLLVLSFILKP